MKPNSRFNNKEKAFWAAVRTISQSTGYTIRGKGQIKVPTLKRLLIHLKN